MKQLGRYSPFVLTPVLVSLLGCASAPTQEGTRHYFNDGIVPTRVKTAVFNEPSRQSAGINIETFSGVVQLRGLVGTQSSENKTVEVAGSAIGV